MTAIQQTVDWVKASLDGLDESLTEDLKMVHSDVKKAHSISTSRWDSAMGLIADLSDRLEAAEGRLDAFETWRDEHARRYER